MTYQDPYNVLGVSPDATDDEVKTAYRKLARKYHPDAHENDPNKEWYEEKFRETQAAYDRIMDIRSGKAGASGSGSAGSGPGGTYEDFFNSFFRGQAQGYTDSYDSPELQAADRYIQNGAYQEALNLLNRLDNGQRNAKYHFLRSRAHMGLQNRFYAMEDAQKAVELDPNNTLYRNNYNQIANQGTTYSSQADQTYGRGGLFSEDSCCTTLLCLSLCCPCNGPC